MDVRTLDYEVVYSVFSGAEVCHIASKFAGKRPVLVDRHRASL